MHRSLCRRGRSVRSALPVKTVHHLQLPSQVFLRQVVQHAGIHQALHEVAAVLREAQAGQPLVADPLVVHVPVGQRLLAVMKYHQYREHSMEQVTRAV